MPLARGSSSRSSDHLFSVFLHIGEVASRRVAPKIDKRVGGFLGPPLFVLGIWDALFDFRLRGRAFPVGGRIIICSWLLWLVLRSARSLLFAFDSFGVYYVALGIILLLSISLVGLPRRESYCFCRSLWRVFRSAGDRLFIFVFTVSRACIS